MKAVVVRGLFDVEVEDVEPARLGFARRTRRRVGT